ncbi:MAG TPA: glycosyltransferase, partial [Flavisolibacter sp.]|nr:glycosyltransferase [Flavisolibacter sp.]
KGVDMLIKAYSQLLNHTLQRGRGVSDRSSVYNPVKGIDIHNTTVPRLVIAGPGLETSYGSSIKKMVEGDPVLKNFIFFPGMLAGDEKWGAFYGCEAFILPSHQENFGIAVVEALACCKPVLISNRVNIWREIEAGGGCIVAADSQSGVCEMISKWLQLSDAEKQMMVHNAGVTYEKYFACRPAAERFYEAVCN